jgi:hypothetical protein
MRKSAQRADRRPRAPPQNTGFAARPALLGNGRSINDPDQPISSRSRNRSPRTDTDQTADQDLEPGHGIVPVTSKDISLRIRRFAAYVGVPTS